MKRAFGVLGVGLLLVIALLLYRATRFTSRQIAAPPGAPLALDTAGAAARFAGALTFRTISYQDSSAFDGAEFSRFQDYLRRNPPDTWETALAKVLQPPSPAQPF